MRSRVSEQGPSYAGTNPKRPKKPDGKQAKRLQTSNGKMRLFLRSRKVLARIEEFQSGGVNSNSLLAWNGQLLVNKRTVRVYDYIYDEGQTRALAEARELARRTGISLVVVDLTREGLLARILSLGEAIIKGESFVAPRRAVSLGKTTTEPKEKMEVSSPVVRP